MKFLTFFIAALFATSGFAKLQTCFTPESLSPRYQVTSFDTVLVQGAFDSEVFEIRTNFCRNLRWPKYEIRFNKSYLCPLDDLFLVDKGSFQIQERCRIIDIKKSEKSEDEAFNY